MSYEDFIRPVTRGVASQFITATAVARHMRRHGSGVILAMAGGREAIPAAGRLPRRRGGPAGPCRQLAREPGPDGIRVAWLLSPGSPDASDPGLEAANVTMLGRRPTLDQVADVVVFLAPTGPVS